MTPIIHRRALMLGLVAAATLRVAPTFAAATILTVRGRIAAPAERSFTLADLEAQPRIAFSTRTPWHDAAVRFEGIGLDQLLALVGADGTRLRLTALNDYVVEVDRAEVSGTGAILAYRADGEIMPVSNKGPLFLIFPFDSDPVLQHQSFYSRAVWQLAAIDVL